MNAGRPASAANLDLQFEPGVPMSPPPATSGPAFEAYVAKVTERATVPSEHNGRFKELYDAWLSQPEDAQGTTDVKRWVEAELSALGLQPSAGYLSCRRSLCRLGIGFEEFSDLHQLRKIALPEGLEPEVTEPYTYGTTNVVIIYWSRGSAQGNAG